VFDIPWATRGHARATWFGWPQLKHTRTFCFADAVAAAGSSAAPGVIQAVSGMAPGIGGIGRMIGFCPSTIGASNAMGAGRRPPPVTAPTPFVVGSFG